MRRRLVLATAGVVALAGIVIAGPTPAPTAPVAPLGRRAVDRRASIEKAEADLRTLVSDAKASAAAALVRQYKRSTEKQLRDPSSRDVDVEKLLDVLKDESVERGIREEAGSAIVGDQTVGLDADLDLAGKGLRRPRAVFSKKALLPILVTQGKSEDDVFLRTSADAILKGLWPGVGTQERDIHGCDPKNLTSCVRAKAAWERWLAK